MEDQNANSTNEQMPATNPLPPTMTVETQQAASPAPVVVTGDSVASSPDVNSSLSSVPEGSWPGAFGIYKYSKAAVKTNIGSVIVLILISLFGGFGAQLILNKGKDPEGLVSFLISCFTLAASAFVYVSGVRGQHVSVGQTLGAGAKYFLKMLILNILLTFSLVLSIVLFIVPFFFVMPRLTLANYFLVDKNMGILEAYKASWAATKGNALKVWGIVGASFLMAVLMITIIGLPFSIYFLIMYSAAYAVLYEYINKGAAGAASSPIGGSNEPVAPATAPEPSAPTEGGQPTGTVQSGGPAPSENPSQPQNPDQAGDTTNPETPAGPPQP